MHYCVIHRTDHITIAKLRYRSTYEIRRALFPNLSIEEESLSIFIAFSPSISILGYALKMSKRIVSKLFLSLFFPFFLHPLRPSDFRSRILGKFGGEVRSRCSARSCICTKTMPLSTSLRINLPQSVPSFISLARINRSVEKYGRSRV